MQEYGFLLTCVIPYAREYKSVKTHILCSATERDSFYYKVGRLFLLQEGVKATWTIH